MTIYAQDTEVINGNSEKLIKEKGWMLKLVKKILWTSWRDLPSLIYSSMNSMWPTKSRNPSPPQCDLNVILFYIWLPHILTLIKGCKFQIGCHKIWCKICMTFVKLGRPQKKATWAWRSHPIRLTTISLCDNGFCHGLVQNTTQFLAGDPKYRCIY
jgi:hypothetical protein